MNLRTTTCFLATSVLVSLSSVGCNVGGEDLSSGVDPQFSEVSDQGQWLTGYIIGSHGQPVEIQYTVQNGRAVQGDMSFGPAESIASTREEALRRLELETASGESFDEDGTSRSIRPSVMYKANSLWPNGIVYYQWDGSLPPGNSTRNVLQQAITYLNSRTAETGVSLVEGSNGGRYVRLAYGPDQADVGYLGGLQWLTFKNTLWQVGVHEFGHTLGLWHEHQRCNQGDFLYIYAPNDPNIGAMCDQPTVPNEPYNTMSVMHYSVGEFNGRAAFKPGVPVAPAKSLHPGLDAYDVRNLAYLYRGGGNTFSLVSLMHGRCLDSPSSANGTRVHMYDCQGANHANQRWSYNQGTGELKIFGNKCLDAWTGRRLDPVVVHDCHGGGNQKWDVGAPGQLRLRGITDEYGRALCADIANFNRDNGAQLLLQYCHRGDNQAWRRSNTGIGGATFNIESDLGRCADANGSTTGTQLWLWDCAASNVNQRFTRTVSSELRLHGKCLDGDGLQPNQPAKLWDCHGGTNQKWNRDPAGRLVSVGNPNVCVDVSGGASANGARLMMYSCHTGTNQKWTYNHIVNN